MKATRLSIHLSILLYVCLLTLATLTASAESDPLARLKVSHQRAEKAAFSRSCIPVGLGDLKTASFSRSCLPVVSALSRSCPNPEDMATLALKTSVSYSPLAKPYRVAGKDSNELTRIVHACSMEELSESASKDSTLVIVDHSGQSKLYGYNTYFLQHEEALIFVNRANPVDDLSEKQVNGILSGKIHNWKQVGGNDGDIKVYMHGGTPQKQKFQILLSRGSIDVQKLIAAKPNYQPNYKLLNYFAAKDKMCIVFGLKSQDEPNLKLLSVGGVKPLQQNAGYPSWLTMDVFLHMKGTAEAEVITSDYLRAIEY